MKYSLLKPTFLWYLNLWYCNTMHNLQESLLHLSDLAHNHVLMLHDPSWFIDFDHHPDQAIATRRKVFAEIGATRERAYGFHLPWPGLGVIVPKGKDSYFWSADSWRWDV